MSTQAEFLVAQRTPRVVSEELANSITHGFGLLLCLAAAAPLYFAGASTGKPEIGVGCLVYIASLIAVYTASTLSHAIQHPRFNRHLRIWDQGLIYLMIAGSYTPFLLIYRNSGQCERLLYVVWGLAFCGFFSKIFWNHRIDAVATVSYVLLGWVPAMATCFLVPKPCLAWLVVGGLCYTIGTFFLKSDHKVRYFHAVWHILVIAGTASHYCAVLSCLHSLTV